MENIFENRIMPVTSITSGHGQEITPDIYCLPIQIVNVYFLGNPHEGKWVLVDGGMPRTADIIIEQAKDRFGAGSKPEAIVLTHGHFDHVGALVDLVKEWEVPVYAHELEMPYLTGKEEYPKADPTVDGGLITEMSPMFPNHSINLENHVHTLPENGKVPGTEDWTWIFTPGHTKGHISLFREKGRSLIAGDAFVTVKQEALYKVITQKQEISGPPKYFTTNWEKARNSVEILQQLNPQIACTGHGIPMSEDFLEKELKKLVDHFDTIAVPENGKFVH